MDSDEILKAKLHKALSECCRLREENAQLRLRIHQSKDPLPSKDEQVVCISSMQLTFQLSATDLQIDCLEVVVESEKTIGVMLHKILFGLAKRRTKS